MAPSIQNGEACLGRIGPTRLGGRAALRPKRAADARGVALAVVGLAHAVAGAAGRRHLRRDAEVCVHMAWLSITSKRTIYI